MRNEAAATMRGCSDAGYCSRFARNGLPNAWRGDERGRARMLQAHGPAMRTNEHAIVAFLLPDGASASRSHAARAARRSRSANHKRTDRAACGPSSIRFIARFSRGATRST
jgi:hypothetical protein